MAPGRNFIINLLANPSPATKAFQTVGRAAGRLPAPIGIATAALTASFAAVAAAVGKVGKELLELGEEFNDAYSTIQVGTGAIGADLDELRQSFRDVVSEVPSSFGDVAAAMSEVNTRTGLTGDDLESLTEKFLNLSRLTGGEVVADIRSVTRMFNRFGVDAEDMGDMLEYVFAASQATGIGVSTLGDQTVEYGHRINQLGMSLEEGIALFGLIERQGVSVGRVFPSIGVAVTNLRKEGFDNVTEGLGLFIDELRTLDATAAEQRAMDVLGSEYRVFLDLVRDNNIDYAALVDQLEDSQTTINGTAKETDGVKEAWQEFLNFLKLQFEEPAMLVFENVKGVIEELKPVAEEVMEAYSTDGLAGALDVVQKEWNRIYDQYIEPIWDKFLDFLDQTVKPAAIQLGVEIGGDLAAAIGNGLVNWLKNNWMDLIGNLFTFSPLAMAIRGIAALNILPEFEYSETNRRRGRDAAGDRLTAQIPGYGDGRNNTVAMMAAGGVVTSPTLSIIGEAGPEAVIPLDRMGQMGGNNVYVTVTSADPQAVVDAIRRYTRANGPLGQVVAV